MNFIKPGCHGIIIYDPATREFFKKTCVIPYRAPDPSPFHSTSIPKTIQKNQKPNNPSSSAIDESKNIEKKQLFPIKLAFPE